MDTGKVYGYCCNPHYSILDNLSFCGRSGNEKSKEILKIAGKIKKKLCYMLDMEEGVVCGVKVASYIFLL